MKYIKLKNICRIRTGKLDANAEDINGKYPFFTCAKEPLRINTFAYDCNCILLGGNGEFNINIYNGKFNAYQRTYIIESIDENKYLLKYLFYILKNKIYYFKNISSGVVIKFIKIGDIENINIPNISVEIQKKIVSELDYLNELVEKNNVEIVNFEELIKSRFIEMFNNNYQMVKTQDICEYITKGTTPPFGEIKENYTYNSVPYLKVYNLSFDGKLLFDEKPQFISNKIHNGILSRSKVYPNDVLMNIVGPPLGKFSIVTDDYKEWNINQAICIFRAKDKVYPKYLLRALMHPSVLEPIIKNAVGVRQLNISLEQCRNLEIPLPPLDVQKRFSNFIELIDKLKFIAQKRIDLYTELLNKKMDEYFN